MDKIEFRGMIERISSLIQGSKQCSLAVADGGGKIEDMSIKDYNQICKLARQIQADEDRILKTELSHVIGMCHLDKDQKVELCDKIEELSQYRTAVKCLASYPTVKNIVPGGTSSFEARCLLGGKILVKENFAGAEGGI